MTGASTMLLSLLPLRFHAMGRMATVTGLLNASAYVGSALASTGFGGAERKRGAGRRCWPPGSPFRRLGWRCVSSPVGWGGRTAPPPVNPAHAAHKGALSERWRHHRAGRVPVANLSAGAEGTAPIRLEGTYHLVRLSQELPLAFSQVPPAKATVKARVALESTGESVIPWTECEIPPGDLARHLPRRAAAA